MPRPRSSLSAVLIAFVWFLVSRQFAAAESVEPPLVARPDEAIVRYGLGTPIEIKPLLNDGTPGNWLQIVSAYSQYASISIEAGNIIRYVPRQHFPYKDRFVYTIRDLSGRYASSEITIRRPFDRFRGTYEAAIRADQASVGIVRLEVGKTGSFTGSLHFSGKVRRLHGQFDDQCAATCTLPTDTGAIVLNLRLDRAGPDDWEDSGYWPLTELAYAGVLSGSVEVTPGETLPIEPTHAFGIVSGSPPARMTMSLEPIASPGGASWQSVGFALGKVSASGRMRLAGRLPDNVSFSVGTTMRRDGLFSVHVAPYGLDQGQLTGTIHPKPELAAFGIEWQSELTWTRLQDGTVGSVSYEPFSTTLDAQMAPFFHAPGEPSLYFADGFGDLTILYEGNQFQGDAFITNRDTIRFLTPNFSSSRMRINRVTGLVKGAFFPSLPPPQRASFIGVAHLGKNEAIGILPGGRVPGSFRLQSRPWVSE